MLFGIAASYSRESAPTIASRYCDWQRVMGYRLERGCSDYQKRRGRCLRCTSMEFRTRDRLQAYSGSGMLCADSSSRTPSACVSGHHKTKLTANSCIARHLHMVVGDWITEFKTSPSLSEGLRCPMGLDSFSARFSVCSAWLACGAN